MYCLLYSRFLHTEKGSVQIMVQSIQADRPTGSDGRQYHLGTLPGALASKCLLVGSPERAEMIATRFFEGAEIVGDKRGFKSFTGTIAEQPISVVTCGMGGPSIGMVLPEAVRSGARAFIRVGTCGALQEHIAVGDSVIFTGAVRFDGASDNWAPIEYPAVAHWSVVAACIAAAKELNLPHHIGIGATTSCFYEGQARPDDEGYVPPRLQARYEELVRRGVLAFAMEEAAAFVWCSTHGGYPIGVVDAVFANRATNAFDTIGEEQAARIAVSALMRLQIDG